MAAQRPGKPVPVHTVQRPTKPVPVHRIDGAPGPGRYTLRGGFARLGVRGNGRPEARILCACA